MELRAFKDLALEHGFSPLVVTIPGRIQVQKKFPDSLFPRRVLEICRRVALPAVDVHGAFVRSLDRRIDPYLPWDNHLSAAGHGLVAAAIMGEFLKRPDEFAVMKVD